MWKGLRSGQETRRRAALTKLEAVIRRNMEELVDGLVRDADSLPCEIAEMISIRRIADREKSRIVGDVMAEAPTIPLGKSIAEAARLLTASPVSMVAVVSEKGKLIGIVTDWDITRAMAMELSAEAPLTWILTADVIHTRPDAPILECIRILEIHEISAMPVVENNRLAGIVSGDILARQTLLRLLQTME